MPKQLPWLIAVVVLAADAASGQAPLVPETVASQLAAEISGERAKRDLEFLARLHRMRGSRDFRRAAEHVASELRAAGLHDVAIEQFAADG